MSGVPSFYCPECGATSNTASPHRGSTVCTPCLEQNVAVEVAHVVESSGFVPEWADTVSVGDLDEGDAPDLETSDE